MRWQKQIPDKLASRGRKAVLELVEMTNKPKRGVSARRLDGRVSAAPAEGDGGAAAEEKSAFASVTGAGGQKSRDQASEQYGRVSGGKELVRRADAVTEGVPQDGPIRSRRSSRKRAHGRGQVALTGS